MRGKKVSGFRRRIQAKRRSLNFNKHRKQADFKWIPKLLISLLEVAVIIGAAYACVFFFGKAVYAIGDSMAPNIVEDDALLLNRFDYVFRSPKRGDVVAFKVGGREEASVSVKRIIGLPGETVWINGGKVFLEEEPKVANTRRLIMEHIENLKEEIKDLSSWSYLYEYQIKCKKQEIKHFKDYLKQLNPNYWEEL